MTDLKVNTQTFPYVGATVCVLTVLKALELITLSWYWIFSPLLLVAGIMFLAGLVIGLAFFVTAVKSVRKRRAQKKRADARIAERTTYGHR